MMRFLVFISLIVAVAAAFGYLTLKSFNYFDRVERDFAGSCTPVSGLAGPEDIQIDHARGRAFVSSLDRREDGARGAIHIFDLADPLGAGGWRDRTNGAPEEFEPHGLYFYSDEDHQRLFVVNGVNNAVELFDVLENGDLEHLESFTERRLTSPNDVVAVGPNEFYVTNDVKSGRHHLISAALYLMRSAAGEVLYSNGTIWRVVAEDLRYANGVNVSPSGETLYVAETTGGAIRVYDRDASNAGLRLVRTIAVDGAPDNINVDDEGALWVGAPPKPLAGIRLGKDPEFTAPSQVVRIAGDGDRAAAIYRDTGEEISAATAAARSGSTLLIGAQFEKKFLICNLPAEQN